jgi:hypothetical protein
MLPTSISTCALCQREIARAIHKNNNTTTIGAKMMNLIKLATLVGLASSYAHAATIRAPDASHVADEKKQQQSDEEQRNSNLRGFANPTELFADILLGETCTNNW